MQYSVDVILLTYKPTKPVIGLIILGFTPSGKEYFAFRLESTQNINLAGMDLSKLQIKGKSHNIAIPYISDIQEIIIK